MLFLFLYGTEQQDVTKFWDTLIATGELDGMQFQDQLRFKEEIQTVQQLLQNRRWEDILALLGNQNSSFKLTLPPNINRILTAFWSQIRALVRQERGACDIFSRLQKVAAGRDDDDVDTPCVHQHQRDGSTHMPTPEAVQVGGAVVSASGEGGRGESSLVVPHLPLPIRQSSPRIEYPDSIPLPPYAPPPPPISPRSSPLPSPLSAGSREVPPLPAVVVSPRRPSPVPTIPLHIQQAKEYTQRVPLKHSQPPLSARVQATENPQPEKTVLPKIPVLDARAPQRPALTPLQQPLLSSTPPTVSSPRVGWQSVRPPSPSIAPKGVPLPYPHQQPVRPPVVFSGPQRPTAPVQKSQPQPQKPPYNPYVYNYQFPNPNPAQPDQRQDQAPVVNSPQQQYQQRQYHLYPQVQSQPQQQFQIQYPYRDSAPQYQPQQPNPYAVHGYQGFSGFGSPGFYGGYGIGGGYGFF